MKLAFYDDFRLGDVQGNHIVDMPQVVENQSDLKPSELINYIIANFQRYENLIKTSAENGNPIPIANIKFRAPLPKPVKIVCMAINYLEGGPESKMPPINGF